VPLSQPTGVYYVDWIMSCFTTEYTSDNNTVVIVAETLTAAPHVNYPPSAHATVYGKNTVSASGLFSQLELLLFPFGAVVFLRILRMKR
jgi:hypothetical protein